MYLRHLLIVLEILIAFQTFVHVLGKFRAAIARANDVPTHKFVCPQTEGQEYGWITQPLVCTVNVMILVTSAWLSFSCNCLCCLVSLYALILS